MRAVDLLFLFMDSLYRATGKEKTFPRKLHHDTIVAIIHDPSYTGKSTFLADRRFNLLRNRVVMKMEYQDE